MDTQTSPTTSRVAPEATPQKPSGFPATSLVLLALYLACIFALQPAFFSAGNLWGIVYYTCLLVPAVIGVHVLVVLGLFDLSVGAVASMCGVVAAKAITAGFPIPLGLALGFAAGAGFGVLNWLFVVRLRISALIGTLITMGVARAVSLAITEGVSIGGLPNDLGRIALGGAGSVPPVVVLGVLLICAFEFLTQRHVLVRRFYHVGSNPAAAAGAGIIDKAVA